MKVELKLSEQLLELLDITLLTTILYPKYVAVGSGSGTGDCHSVVVSSEYRLLKTECSIISMILILFGEVARVLGTLSEILLCI